MVTWTTTKKARIYSGEKAVSFIGDDEKTESHMLKKKKQTNLEDSVTPYTKIISKLIKGLNVRLVI